MQREIGCRRHHGVHHVSATVFAMPFVSTSEADVPTASPVAVCPSTGGEEILMGRHMKKRKQNNHSIRERMVRRLLIETNNLSVEVAYQKIDRILKNKECQRCRKHVDPESRAEAVWPHQRNNWRFLCRDCDIAMGGKG